MSHSSNRTSTARRSAVIIAAAFLLVVLSVSLAAAHDMFVKPAAYFLPENGATVVRVLNGTFSLSENAIARPRVQDISIVGPAGRFRMDTSGWSAAGDTSTFQFRAAGAGTYALGVSTRPNVIEMRADTFHLYLAEDGIPDELEARKKAGMMTGRVKERYSKHVKAFVQVGDSRSNGYATVLGYPAEILPLSNPYSARPGRSMRVRVLVDGKPVANQYVLYGGRTPSGSRLMQRSVRSDADGVATIPLRSAGTWYVKFIHMARLTSDPAADYESKWATVSFQVR